MAWTTRLLELVQTAKEMQKVLRAADFFAPTPSASATPPVPDASPAPKVTLPSVDLPPAGSTPPKGDVRTTEEFLASLGITHPFTPKGQFCQGDPPNYGVMNLTFRESLQALSPDRFSTILLRFVPESTDGNRLILAPSDKAMPSFFAAGLGEPGKGAGDWRAVGSADSNLLEGGAPVERDQMFLAFGHLVEPAGVFLKGTADKPELCPRIPIDPNDLISSNLNAFWDAIFQGLGHEVTFGHSVYRYELGSLGGWTRPARDLPYRPYASPFIISARDEARKMLVSLHNSRGLNEPIRVPCLTTTSCSELFAAVRLRMYGVSICSGTIRAGRASQASATKPSSTGEDEQMEEIKKLIREGLGQFPLR